MAKTKAVSSSSSSSRKLRPALSPEARENQMISLAMDCAEQQLIDGTASSQVITHFLKLGTAKAQVELEKLRQETELAKAKTKAVADADEMKELYDNAIKAMRNYSGQGEPDDY